MKTFKYFRDPINFAFVSDQEVPCSICGIETICFTSNSFYGEVDIDYICDECVITGKAQESGLSGNDICDNDVKSLIGEEDEVKARIEEIIYKTPKIPSWQDLWWPVANGDFCVFSKIASKLDFSDKHDLYKSIPITDLHNKTDDELWSMLPEGPIGDLKSGNYNVSFYLFTSKDQKIVLWDSN